MTKEQVTFIGIMDEFRNGDTQKAKSQAVEIIDQYIWSLLHKHYQTYVSYHEDMYNEAVCGILENMNKYLPEKAVPITFFRPHIIHCLAKYVNENVHHTSAHYATMQKKVKLAEEKLKAAGETIEVSKICAITELSSSDVNKVNARRGFTEQKSYGNNPNDIYMDSNLVNTSESPEQTYIKREMSEALKNAFKTLDETEVQVVTMLMSDSKVSYASVGREMGMNPDAVKRIYNNAVLCLRDDSNLAALFHDNIHTASTAAIQNEIQFNPTESTEKMLDTIEFLNDDEPTKEVKEQETQLEFIR